MISLWSCSRSVVYRHKRILILLCTFGISFIAFNYSLLSSSSSAVIQQTHNNNEDNYESTGISNGRQIVNYNHYEELLRKPVVSEPLPAAVAVQLTRRKIPVSPSSSLNSTRERKVRLELFSEKLAEERYNGKIEENGREIRERIGGSYHFQDLNDSDSQRKTETTDPTQQIKLFSTLTADVVVEGENENSIRRLSTRNSIEALSIHQTTPRAESLPPPSPSVFESNNNNGRGSNNSNNNNNLFISTTVTAPATTTSTMTMRTSKNEENNVRRVHTFRVPACNTPLQLRRVQKRKKNLTVIENFIMGSKRVKCNESITYTTHGDYRYLDNLVPLADRWNGPVSLAIYCPGLDLQESLRIISYLKTCTSSKIDEWVTFHLIYDVKHTKRPQGNYSKPGDISWLDAMYQSGKWTDCSKEPSFSKGDYTFRNQNGLLYPINIARNIARSAATTYFVLASDIELYPSINLIPSFMQMLRRLQKKEEEDEEKEKKKQQDQEKMNLVRNNISTSASSSAPLGGGGGAEGGLGNYPSGFPNSLQVSVSSGGNETAAEEEKQKEKQPQPLQQSPVNIGSRYVFVLPVFEVKKNIVPCQVETKRQLTALLKNKSAVLFHYSICPQCHKFPKYEEWKHVLYYDFTDKELNMSCSASENSPLRRSKVSPMKIFHKAKRKSPFQLWEPIFIGTKSEPIYDERLSWEGLRDKMVSAYVMCIFDYDFFIIDNAFLVHKPGVRKLVHLVTKTVVSQDRLINNRIRSELLKKFGKHDECAL